MCSPLRRRRGARGAEEATPWVALLALLREFGRRGGGLVRPQYDFSCFINSVLEVFIHSPGIASEVMSLGRVAAATEAHAACVGFGDVPTGVDPAL